MSNNNAASRQSSALEFLSGNGPNPIPEKKRSKGGPLEKKFVNEAMQEISMQDRENDLKEVPTVAEDLIAVIRLISDNHELIQLIQSGTIATMSDLAAALGRELSNVSRTLSRMAAYGLIESENVGGDARAKKPVWQLSTLSSREDLDWIQAYCLVMALQNNSAAGLGATNFSKIERAVRDLISSTADQINLLKSAVPSP